MTFLYSSYHNYLDFSSGAALSMREVLLELARSGGSDFHGDAKPDVEMGTGRGSLEVPFDYYEDLHSIIT